MGTTPEFDLDLRLLKIFVAVAEHTSFSKASKQLGVTTGTASRSIARLEKLVGAQLFHRDTHSVSLSTAGIALFDRTAPHLAALTQAVRHLPEWHGEPSGLLRITSNPAFGLTLLPLIVASFSLRFPEVTFDIRLTDDVVNLVAEGFDLSIRAASQGLRDSGLTVRKIGGLELRFFASPQYLTRRGQPSEYGDPAHEWVVFGPSTRLFKPKPGGAIRCVTTDFIFARELLRAGAGVGALPPFVAEEDVRTGKLVEVMPTRALRAPGALYLLSPSSGQTSRKLRAFRDFLITTLKATPIA